MRHFVVLLFICNFLYPCSAFSLSNLFPLFASPNPCWSWEFNCDDHKCLPHRYRCNGVKDCNDNSDEKNCKKDGVVKDIYENDDYDNDDLDHITCGKDEYKCKTDECIPKVKFCDVMKDCSDGSDEYDGCVENLNCSNRFQCKDRHCVFKEWVCDGSKDCPDGSDELNCRANKTASDCRIQNFQYLCRNQRCIPLDAVCDKKDDCGDGSDEGAGCTSSCKSVKCNHECKQTPKGSICVCKPGYKLQNDNRTCIDINECQTYGICDQGCINSLGSYNCTCQTSYFLQDDKKTCKAHAGEATLVFSTRTKIIGLYLDSKLHFELAFNLNHAVGVAMNDNHVYWSDIEENRKTIVKRINNSKNQHEVIVTTGLSEITSIAVDWVTNNIYFTDEGYERIGVCTNNGTYCTVLIKTEKPAGIVLLSTRGKMYWCDWGFIPRIAMAGMDGKDESTFVSVNLEWPKSVTIDYPNDRLYWIDAKSKIIESIRLDGTDRRIILHDIIRNPFSLAVFENKLYWSDWDSHSIESCNKFTGKDWHILFQTKQHQPYSVHIDHSAIKPKIDNPCRFNPCSELCLLNQYKGYTCACTLDKELNPDNHTCRESRNKHHLMIINTNENIFINYYYEMLGKPKITHASKQLRRIKQIMSDPTSGQIIMSENDWSRRNILRYKPHTNIFESVITIRRFFLNEIAFDYIGNNIYTINDLESSIEVYSIKTNAMTAFYFTQHHPEYITLAPEESKMYVAAKENTRTFSIYEMQMNGLGKKKLIRDKLSGPKILMCYDSDSKTLFVNDPFAGYILMYSAKDTRILRTGLKPLVSLTVANGNIFWIERDSTILYWTNFTTSSNHKGVAINTSFSNSFLVTLRNDVKQDHVCQRNNGNCSHVCLPSHITSFICACPPKMELSNDNRTCIQHRECFDHEYKCTEHRLCIQKEKLCDGIKDCPNGEDEAEKRCEEKWKCMDNEFKCRNGHCIKSRYRCNKVFDCRDQSDEENCEIKNCKSDEFRCDDGTCIPNIKICDLKIDCRDFSDEKYSLCNSLTCAPEQFTCNDRKCIPAKFVCDGDYDCKNGEDEAFGRCKTKYRDCGLENFSCNNGNCISLSLRCDGNDDCHDGSDEMFCKKSNRLVNCTANEYRCSNSNICLEKKLRCNGVPDCPRHDDEHNCSFCSNTEFTCNNKKCIPKRWVCDKMNDCGDNSDENSCDGNKNIIKESLNVNKCDEFECSMLGTCLSYSQVCDGVRDCLDGSDENGECQTACVMNNICKGVCHRTPIGAICGCQDGYRLAADRISCKDINECESENNCSQICQNTEGSYECSCYEGYVIHNDKVTCKSIGPPMEFITVTDNDIRKISSNLHLIETIYPLTGLSTSGLDVNILQESVYWSDDEFGTIKKFNLNSKKIITLSIVEHPRALAVDWITDNVYVSNNDRPNMIKVCNLDAQRCAPVVKIEDKAKAEPLVVDSINRWLFWAEISWQVDMPSSKICRTDMIGADMKIIVSNIGLVSGMAIDLLNSKLYWSDSFHNIIESSNFDGSERSRFLNTVYRPLDISIYERSLYWLMGTTGRVRVCKLRDNGLCDKTFDLGTNNVHKFFTIFHASRQPIAENPCKKEDYMCDYMCVLKNDNATCICSDGELIKSNTTCTINTSESKNELKSGLKFIKNPSKHNMSSTYSVTIIVLLVGVMLLCVYYFYQKNKLKLKPKTDLSSIRFQNPSYDRRDEVEVTLDSLTSNLSPGQHEYINPIDNKYLSMKAMMESSESRRKSNQYSEERDVEETEKPDSLIYLVHSK